MASGHALPSRNRGKLSFGNATCAGEGDSLSIIGAPKPIRPKTIEFVDATFRAASPILVGKVHEAAHTRVDRGDHRRSTHRMDIDLDTNLGRLVDDGLADLDFL
jgi:hypothetical protein